MKAINFNFVCGRMQEGETYNFTHTCAEGSTDFDLKRAGNTLYLSVSGQNQVLQHTIFRDKETVKTALTILLRDKGPATLKSGEVYKANILAMMSDNYTKEYNHTNTARYHATRGLNMPVESQPYMLGVELELMARNREAAATLDAIQSNIFHRERDCSIGDDYRGQEWISCPLTKADATSAEFWAEFCDVWEQFAISKSLNSTGLHVHISRTAFGEDETAKAVTLAKVMYLHDFLMDSGALSRIYGRGESIHYAHRNSGNNGDAATIAKLSKKAPAIMRAAELQKMIAEDLENTSDRYNRINCTNSATIEFRQGKGQINSKEIAKICQFVALIVEFCRVNDWHKVTPERFAAFIPTSHKYDELRRALSDTEE